MNHFSPYSDYRGLRDVLDWSFHQCEKRKDYCDRLEHIVRSGTASERVLGSLIDWLCVQLEKHFRFEADFMLPTLNTRAEVEGDVETVTALLMTSQKVSREHISEILPKLKRMASEGGGRLESSLARGLTHVAAQERRHLALFMRVILPIARVRLTDLDLDYVKGGIWIDT